MGFLEEWFKDINEKSISLTTNEDFKINFALAKKMAKALLVRAVFGLLYLAFRRFLERNESDERERTFFGKNLNYFAHILLKSGILKEPYS